jgi:DDE superfamily endonuclease
MSFINWCDQHKILVALYPPHSTHRLQPLDVGLFRPLANFYSQELNNWIHKTQGLCRISKREFFSIFWPAFQRAFTLKNINSSWEKTGLHPFNPKKVLDQITTSRSDIRPPSSSHSTGSSALSSADWRTIRRLMKDVVGEVLGPEVRSLANTLEKLTTENSILVHENEGLRKAVFIEKSRRKRGKPLFDLFRDESEVKAMFFSPTKIQAARDSQTQKQQEKQRLEAQKQHDKLQRLLEKENKAKEAQQKKYDREEARAQKQQEMKDKKATREQAKEDRLIQQQLQRELKGQEKETKNNRKACILAKSVVVVPLPTAEGTDSVPKGGRPRRVKRMPNHLHDYDL